MAAEVRLPSSAVRTLLAAAGRHRHLAVLLVLGAGLRAAAWLAIHPGWWIIGDSIGYFRVAMEHYPERYRPGGYALVVLWPLWVAHRLSLVTLVQHLMGLAVGVIVYATARRLGLPRWGAALAAIPALLDGYMIGSEQMFASEALFVTAVTAGVAALVWRIERPGYPLLAASGLLLGLAAITRSVGLPLIAVPLLLLLVHRRGWLRPATLAAGFAVPVLAYASWFAQTHGTFGLTASNGLFLYGQATQFADCGRLHLSSERLRSLCPDGPVPLNPNYYIFDGDSPVARLGASESERDRLAGQFAAEAIAAQPGDYARQIWRGIVQSFAWDSEAIAADVTFSPNEPMNPEAAYLGFLYQASDPGRDPRPLYRPGLVSAMAAYQRAAHIPGTLLLLALLVTAAGLLLGRDAEGRALRPAALACAGIGTVLVLVPTMTAIVDQRYLLPAIPVLSLASGASAALLANRWRAWRRWRQREARARAEARV